MFLQLFIINRSGGLVFNKNLSSAAPNLSTNDCLRLGSTFHSLHAIATQIAPVISMGIETLETDTFKLQCFQSLTGAKFVVTATPGTSELDVLLHSVYEIYADYVLKVKRSACFTFLFPSMMFLNYRVANIQNNTNTFHQDPFYEMDMPIRCDLFNRHLDKLVQRSSAVQSRKRAP